MTSVSCLLVQLLQSVFPGLLFFWVRLSVQLFILYIALHCHAFRPHIRGLVFPGKGGGGPLFLVVRPLCAHTRQSLGWGLLVGVFGSVGRLVILAYLAVGPCLLSSA